MSSVNVLSIDGGGIRGVVSAEVLIYVEKKLQELTNSNIRLSDHFDLIVGTSTGGILTCIYTLPDSNGKPKYSSVDASNLYLEHGGKIFEKKLKHRLKTVFGLIGGPRFSVDNMEKLFTEYFGETRISKSTTNIMLTSVNTMDNDLYLFKSYKAINDPLRDFKFRDSARSTSAAPVYFQPKKMMLGEVEMSLVDGGMAINNPSISAYIEARKLYPSSKINLLSVGTGRRVRPYLYKKVRNWGVVNWITKITNFMLVASAKGVEYQAKTLYETELDGNYLRVEPILRKDVDDEMSNASKKNIERLRLSGIESVELYKDRIDEFLIKSLI